jgi:yecA family protein
MTPLPSYNELEQLLEESNAYLGASETQGLLLGYTSWQPDLPEAWLETVLKEASGDSAKKMRDTIQNVLSHCQEQLTSFSFELEILLPGDEQPLPDRSEELSQWCQGYLLGLEMGRGKHKMELSDDTADALDTIKQIAKLSPELELDEQTEEAYVELTEFVKLTATMVFTELNSKGRPTYH